ncbi:MAG: tryptophan synthase subunit alpha [Vicinamibacterales bacterium]
MTTRIDRAFARLRGERRCGLVTYVTAGDPDLRRSADVLKALDRGGADVIEVGVPFSEPLADGPVIQRAAERALAAGTSLRTTLDLIRGVREEIGAAVVLFTYANPVHRMGRDAFVRAAADAGVDGVLVLDLPVEEAGELRDALTEARLDPIFLLSPTTSDERIRRASALGSGFLYAISRLGVTGTRPDLAGGLDALVARIRAATTMPIAVGFGISRAEHVAAIGRLADAAVVGSALVDLVARTRDAPDLAAGVEAYVRWLAGRAPRPDDVVADGPAPVSHRP